MLERNISKIVPGSPSRSVAVEPLFPLIDRPMRLHRNTVRLLLVNVVVPMLGAWFVPGVTALYFATVVMSHIVLIPLLRLRTMRQNIRLHYKSVKSRLTVSATLISYGIGILVAGFFASQTSLLWAATFFISHVHTNLSLTLAGGLVGVWMPFHPNPMLRYLIGVVLTVGLMTVCGLPVLFTPMFDAGVLIALCAGLFANLIAKQVLRAITRYRHGHSNADGYLFALARNRLLAIDSKQADVFTVNATYVLQVRRALLSLITELKSSMACWGDQKTDQAKSYLKNLFYMLMTATPKQAKKCRELLQISKQLFLPFVFASERFNQYLLDSTLSMSEVFEQSPLLMRALQDVFSPAQTERPAAELKLVFRRAMKQATQEILAEHQRIATLLGPTSADHVNTDAAFNCYLAHFRVAVAFTLNAAYANIDENPRTEAALIAFCESANHM
jgi:hypothetical protein